MVVRVTRCDPSVNGQRSKRRRWENHHGNNNNKNNKSTKKHRLGLLQQKRQRHSPRTHPAAVRPVRKNCRCCWCCWCCWCCCCCCRRRCCCPFLVERCERGCTPGVCHWSTSAAPPKSTGQPDRSPAAADRKTGNPRDRANRSAGSGDVQHWRCDGRLAPNWIPPRQSTWMNDASTAPTSSLSYGSRRSSCSSF